MTALALAACLSQAAPAVAVPTQEILRGYESEARKESASFMPSVTRGESLFRTERSTARGDKLACATCHTNDPRQSGITRAHKTIEPLAPVANPLRFTDPAKVEKWFGRNCADVFTRSCTAAEKADLITWLLTIK